MRGFSLIEVVVLIVVMSVMATGLFATFPNLLRAAAEPLDTTRALHLAQERLELILGQRKALGFAGFIATTFDPCTATPPSTLAVCTSLPTGYTITSSYTANWSGNVNYKYVKVAVNGPKYMELEALVANY